MNFIRISDFAMARHKVLFAFEEAKIALCRNYILYCTFKYQIFQPIFTTKPTGSVTGLGLSLSYDIVKAHGGESREETIQGEGREFIIELPLTK